jgi:peptide/nickel transport system permease protein
LILFISLLFISVPGFWLGILLMILFAIIIPILPAGGYVSPLKDFPQYLRSMILPVTVLAATLAASTIRMLRSSMLDVLNEDYITLARVKGASNIRVLFVHALRNALGPIFSVVSMQVAFLMGGAIVIERVFQYPGLGLVLLNAVELRDYPLVQCGIMIFATIVMIVYLFTDILYAIIDPKVRIR